jgi:hypothetical protein
MRLSLMHCGDMICKYVRFAVLARLQNLTVVLKALRLVLSGRWCWFKLHVGVASAEHVGRHVAVGEM